jgi:uncharacterized protein YxjI
MEFSLKTKAWSFGDLAITGPGGYSFFRVLRSNSSMLFSAMLRNATFTLATMAGEPMLVLQEEFAWLSYTYQLYRMLPGGALVHLCTVRGVHVWAQDVYEVTMAPALASVRISCTGVWPNRVVLTQESLGGMSQACVVERQAMSFTDAYRVHLSPGTDVLLYLGICSAIDRIHHEIEEKHRREERARQEAAAVAAAAAMSHHHHHPPPPMHGPGHHNHGGHGGHGHGGGHH